MGAKRLQTEKNNEEKKKTCLRIFKKQAAWTETEKKPAMCPSFAPFHPLHYS
jgi:hypothetical protein